MLARSLHDLLKWMLPALFGGAIAIAGLAVAASQVWQEAKIWTESTFDLLFSIIRNPTFPWLATLFFMAWLLAFLWSAHAVKEANSAPVSSAEPPSPALEGLQKPVHDMPPLKNHFFSDFKGVAGEVAVGVAFNQEIEFPDGLKLEILYNQEFRFSSHAKFLVLYVPHCGRTISVAQYIADNIKTYIQTGESTFAVGGGGNEETKADDLVFTGKVFVYHEDSLTLPQRGELDSYYRERGLVLQLRSSDYVLSCRETTKANEKL